ncbi:MAG: hypothetical protein ACXU8U_08495, partial [Asticcacaulis sp.]
MASLFLGMAASTAAPVQAQMPAAQASKPHLSKVSPAKVPAPVVAPGAGDHAAKVAVGVDIFSNLPIIQLFIAGT